MPGPNFFENTADSKRGPDFFKKDPTTKISKKHEKDTAKRAGSKQTPGSGNKKGKPGDVYDSEYLRECKATQGAGISIKRDWLEKLYNQALCTQRVPLLELRMEGLKASGTTTDWVLIPSHTFTEMVEKLNG